MRFCDAHGGSTRMLACPSERHCLLGLGAGACATCLPGTHRCTGTQLEVCDEQGRGYTLVRPCPSAALCNADNGTCAMGCTAGERICVGDVLRRCKADLTGFEDLQPCDPGRCDGLAKECDVCVPTTRTCEPGGVRICNAQGQGYTMEACAAPRNLCTGAGTCVQCTAANPCSAPTNPCETASCNVSSGLCEVKPRPAGSMCPNGTCNANGTCVVCDPAACPAGECTQGACVNGRCGAPKPLPAGATCNTGMCDGAGSCVGRICTGPITIRTADDLADYKNCREVRGDLILDATFATLAATDFPILKTVTGSLRDSFGSALRSTTFGALESVGTLSMAAGGALSFPKLTSVGSHMEFATNQTRIELPALTTVGGMVNIAFQENLTRIDLRALRSVGGDVNLADLYKLSSLNLSSLNRVGGNMTLRVLLELPYSSIRALNESEPAQNRVQGTLTIEDIGCCLAPVPEDNHYMCSAAC